MKIDPMEKCLFCGGKVGMGISENDRSDRVWKCRNKMCKAEFDLRVEEGYLEDVTGEVVQVIE